MKPLLLRLRGAVGIRDGLGLDEIEIPFAPFASGVVAIVGRNGCGKTTILDNLHPYLELPSRDGSLGEHFFLRDSCREFYFELDGKQYRSQILIDARTGKTEAYLYRGREPLTDGRISTYKPAVERLLGSPNVFFNSVFVAQGSSGVTSLTPSKRKDLFFELLGLQVYEGYVQYSKTRGDEIERDVVGKRALLDQVEKELSQKAAALETIERVEQTLTEVRSEILVAEMARDANDAELQAIRRQREERKRLEEQRLELEDEIATLAQKHDVLEKEFVSDQKKLDHQAAELNEAIAFTTRILDHKEEIEQRLQELKSLRETERAYLSCERSLRDVERQESEALLQNEREWAEYHRSVALLRHQEERLLADERRLELMFDAERAAVRKQLQDAQSSAELISEVPCRQIEGLTEQCKLLASAIEAERLVPTLMTRVHALEHLLSRERPEFAAVRSVGEEIARKKYELEGSEPKPFDREVFAALKLATGYDANLHQQVHERIRLLEEQKWERLHEQLLVGQSVVKEKKKALEKVNDQTIDLQAKHRSAVTELMNQLTSRRGRLTELAPCSPHEADEGRLLCLKGEIDSALDSLRKRELNLHGQRSAAEATVERIEKRETEGRIIQNELGNLLVQVEHWRLLQRACSKDGIPALEFDAAGPGISGIANELLASTFGSRFQISFETTKLSRDRKRQLETFNIAVYGETGEKRIEDLSGGERVWIERAISEAIAIYMSEHSGRRLLTTFQDESDGPLDPDNKQNYFSLLRESFRLGRRFYTFIITQSPDIWEQIEQRIHLKPGVGVELVY